MTPELPWKDASEAAAAIRADLEALGQRNTPGMRQVRRSYSRELKNAEAGFVLELARRLARNDSTRWIGYELVEGHPQAFACLGKKELEELGAGINSWWTVDAFARTLSGPAWRKGQVADAVILEWAHCADQWWRRAALVSTVAWNMRSRGGTGDTVRTLQVCTRLAGDPAEMVTKALSWALRELAEHDPAAVREFMERHETELARQVKREVRHKLKTGLKNPRRKGKSRREGRKPEIV